MSLRLLFLFLLIIISFGLLFFFIVSVSEDAIIKSGSILHAEAWLQVEQLRSIEQWQAWTPTNKDSQEMECIDVERYVPFDDISSYLFLSERKGHFQFRLVVGCLQSLGV